MPEKKHVRGVGDKEQRQYEHIKESAKKSGRYGERAEEVAARTVLKQHTRKKDIRKAIDGWRFINCFDGGDELLGSIVFIAGP